MLILERAAIGDGFGHQVRADGREKGARESVRQGRPEVAAPPSYDDGSTPSTAALRAKSYPSIAPGTTSDVARSNVLQHDTTIELLTVLVSLLVPLAEDLGGEREALADAELRRVGAGAHRDPALEAADRYFLAGSAAGATSSISQSTCASAPPHGGYVRLANAFSTQFPVGLPW